MTTSDYITIWRETLMVYFGVFPGSCQEGLRKTTKVAGFGPTDEAVP
jgi:hypothetical protein